MTGIPALHEVGGQAVLDELEGLDAEHHVGFEVGRIRHQVAVFINGLPITDKVELGDAVPDQAEVYSGYMGNHTLELHPTFRRSIAEKIVADFPSTDAELNREMARLLGMLGIETNDLLTRLSKQWTADSAPATDDSAPAAGTSSASSSTSRSMSATFNQADVAFATDMITHHRQAVEMAEMAGSRASAPEVKMLAAQIAAAQGPEIDLMSGWLESWGAPVPEEMSGMDMSGSMPGMMSLADMDALKAASGTTFDRQFLTMMIAHHQGALQMANTEIGQGSNPDAVALAQKVTSAQTAEIATMKDMLAG